MQKMAAIIVPLPRRETGEEPPSLPSPHEPDIIRRGRDLARQVAEAIESQRARWLLWVPVIQGLGIALYFALPAEPPLILGLVLAPILFALAALAPSRARAFAAGIIGALLAGFLAANIRTLMVEAPRLAAPTGPVRIEGRIDWAEPVARRGHRLILSDLTIEGIPASDVPEKIRLTLRLGETAAGIGDRLRLTARLEPPAGPALPGAYDFARFAYFERIGAVGYAGEDYEVLPRGPRGGFSFDALRQEVQARIARVLPAETAALATALITGARLAIPEEDLEALRDAGLAHILSISGLHLALVTGLVFFLIRGGLSLVEWVALRWPLKKIAAIAALGASAFYLGLSGSAVATERSFIMAAVALIAILLDRPAITLRTVAIAAMLILLYTPESLFNPGFQMSFGAVTLLVAAYEVWSRRPLPEKLSIIDRTRSFLLGIAATSLIAEAGTFAFSAFHFNQVTIYGLIGNEIALPILSLLIMPLALLSVIAMPFGLEAPPLEAMGFFTEQMMLAAHFVADLPFAYLTIESWPAPALVIIVLAGLFLALWQGRARLMALPVVFLAVAGALLHPGPDIAAGDGGEAFAFRVRSEAGFEHAIFGMRPGSFRADLFLQRLGADERRSTRLRDLALCDDLACRMSAGRQRTLTYVTDGRGFAEDCVPGALILTPLKAPADCAAHADVFDRDFFRRNGAVLIWVGEEGVAWRAGIPAGRRPWQASAQ